MLVDLRSADGSVVVATTLTNSSGAYLFDAVRLFSEVDVSAIDLLITFTEHLEHADMLTSAVEVIERDLARITLERLRLRLSARTSELHCHASRVARRAVVCQLDRRELERRAAARAAQRTDVQRQPVTD